MPARGSSRDQNGGDGDQRTAAFRYRPRGRAAAGKRARLVRSGRATAAHHPTVKGHNHDGDLDHAFAPAASASASSA